MAVVGVARHALHHLPEFGRIVPGLGDAFQGVAADAAVEKLFLVRRPREACQPLGIGELRAEVSRLAQPELERRARTVGQLGREWTFQLVPGGANAQRIAAGLELRRGEAEAALGVAHHADRDAGAGLPRADDYTLEGDRKSTRLNSSHGYISYAVFCLKKKKNKKSHIRSQVTSLV